MTSTTDAEPRPWYVGPFLGAQRLNVGAEALAIMNDPRAVPVGQPWRGPIAYIGVPTSDGRQLDTLDWRTLPLSLLWQVENLPGHEGAVVVGSIDDIVIEGQTVWAYGMLDTIGDAGREVIRLIRAGYLRGVSIDASIDGEPVYDEATGVTHMDGTIMAATIVATPAFAEAQIALDDGTDAIAASARVVTPTTIELLEEAPAVTAAASRRPAAEWFSRPAMTRRERLHVEGDGRVWGHIYGWGECHTGSPYQCVRPPKSTHGYAYFLTGTVLTDAGEVPTGPLVIAADHAALRGLSWLQAKDHYAHTGLAVADVACGEDEHGIWVAGMVRPGTPDELVHAFRASPPSGDWRPVGGGLELIAILSVNTPGYPAIAASFGPDGMLEGLVLTSEVASECGCGGTGHATTSIDTVLGELRAMIDGYDEMLVAARQARAAVIEALEVELGIDRAARIAALDAALAAAPARPRLADLVG